MAQEAAALGTSIAVGIGPDPVQGQPATAGPSLREGRGRRQQPPAHSDARQQEEGDEPDEGECAGAKPRAQTHGRDDDDKEAEGMDQGLAADIDEECMAEAGSEDDGFCFEDVEQDGEDNDPFPPSPRTFENPLLRDYKPREQRLEMLIPPHAFPWVAQRIMGGGEPQAMLTRIAAFIDEVFVPEQQEACGIGQAHPAADLPSEQCPAEQASLLTTLQDGAKREPSAERRT